jgi:hypothetical protein
VQSTAFTANPGCQNLQMAGLSITEHIITHFVEHILGDQLCDGLQGNETCDASSNASALQFLH